MSIQFTVPSWYVLVPLFLVLFVYYGAMTFSRKIYSVKQFVLMLTFILYSLAVIHLVIFPIDVNIGQYANQTPWYKSINVIPILTIDIKTFILNVVMLIPLGIYLPLLSSKFNSAASVAKVSLYTCISFEVLQMVIRITVGNGRSTDINDIFANTMGGIAGFLAYKILMKSKSVRHLADRSF